MDEYGLQCMIFLDCNLVRLHVFSLVSLFLSISFYLCQTYTQQQLDVFSLKHFWRFKQATTLKFLFFCFIFVFIEDKSSFVDQPNHLRDKRDLFKIFVSEIFFNLY